VSYDRYAKTLKWLTLVLLTYVATLFIVPLDWSEALARLVAPRFDLSRQSLTLVVAIFGTTISPYLFFWQSSQEVEEVEQDPRAEPLNHAPAQAKRELGRIRLDTFVGMAASNLVAMAIMLATAATLHAHGKTDIQTAADAAAALRPIAGPFAFALFSAGIIGTGLLAVPVLAGSAAYAFCESRGWTCGLENKPWEAVGFYGVIGGAMLVGLAIDFSPVDPMKALIWSAVINGVVAVPVMAGMMIVAGQRDQMGRFTAGRWLRIFGWAATAVMAAAVIALFAVQQGGPEERNKNARAEGAGVSVELSRAVYGQHGMLTPQQAARAAQQFIAAFAAAGEAAKAAPAEASSIRPAVVRTRFISLSPD
jgi:Mn2+/Fe2+ NRAMP family transporter